MKLVFDNSFFRTLTILAVVLLIYIALSHGVSSFKYNYAKNQLQYWTSEGEISDQVAYQSAKESIRSANALWGYNPTYLNTQASILVWGYYEDFEEPDKLHTALETYNRSVKNRPLWPWTWSEWVMTKLRLEEFDDKMLTGLLTLDKVGPYSGDVNLVMVDAGLQMIDHQPDYSAQLKPLILKHYLRAEFNGVIINQMHSLKEEHNNTDWLPVLVYWRDRES